jgi:hypothetical protein
MATVDDVIFRTVKSGTNAQRTDNSGVMLPYVITRNGQDHQHIMYGYITDLYAHTLTTEAPGDGAAPILVVAHVYWYTVVEHLFNNRLPVVKSNKRERWNHPDGEEQFVPLASIYAQNVVFVPQYEDDWNMQGRLVALARQAEAPLDLTTAD